jgi:hypothetical protein
VGLTRGALLFGVYVQILIHHRQIENVEILFSEIGSRLIMPMFAH